MGVELSAYFLYPTKIKPQPKGRQKILGDLL
jgi:hypothetical protein